MHAPSGRTRCRWSVDGAVHTGTERSGRNGRYATRRYGCTYGYDGARSVIYPYMTHRSPHCACLTVLVYFGRARRARGCGARRGTRSTGPPPHGTVADTYTPIAYESRTGVHTSHTHTLYSYYASCMYYGHTSVTTATVHLASCISISTTTYQTVSNPARRALERASQPTCLHLDPEG